MWKAERFLRFVHNHKYPIVAIVYCMMLVGMVVYALAELTITKAF